MRFRIVAQTLFAAVFLRISLAPALAAEMKPEAEMQARICAGMQQGVDLGVMARADCVSETYAIEIDWADKWREEIGQALSNATAMGWRPVLVL